MTLAEMIAAVQNIKLTSKKVSEQYLQLTREIASELDLLLNLSLSELEKKVGHNLTVAITKMRQGELSIKPGYDGVFGEVHIDMNQEQNSLF